MPSKYFSIPGREIPKAIQSVYIRILILGTSIIGPLTPFDHPSLNLTEVSFVIAIQTAGIQHLPSLINAYLLTNAWPAANSNLYTSLHLQERLLGCLPSLPKADYYGLGRLFRMLLTFAHTGRVSLVLICDNAPPALHMPSNYCQI
jgi:hypothetical protein